MDKLSYALGVSVGHNLASSGVSELNVADFSRAIEEALAGTQPSLSYEEINQVLSQFFGKIEQEKKMAQGEVAENNLAVGLAFLEENGKREGVITLGSGLQYEVMVAGNGAIPKISDSVKCHYHGTLIDGTVFDSSVQRNQPAVFGVNQVISGWVEALQLMPIGSKWKLFVPSNLAYGPNGAGGSIGPNTTLIFEVELLEIV